MARTWVWVSNSGCDSNSTPDSCLSWPFSLRSAWAKRTEESWYTWKNMVGAGCLGLESSQDCCEDWGLHAMIYNIKYKKSLALSDTNGRQIWVALETHYHPFTPPILKPSQPEFPQAANWLCPSIAHMFTALPRPIPVSVWRLTGARCHPSESLYSPDLNLEWWRHRWLVGCTLLLVCF